MSSAELSCEPRRLGGRTSHLSRTGPGCRVFQGVVWLPPCEFISEDEGRLNPRYLAFPVTFDSVAFKTSIILWWRNA